MVHAIPGRNLLVLNFAYHLPNRGPTGLPTCMVNNHCMSGKWFIGYWKMFVKSQIRARAFDLYTWSLLRDIFIPVVLLSILYVLACRWNVRKWNIQELFPSTLRDTKVLKQCLFPNAGWYPNLTERNTGFSSYLQLKSVCLNGDHF